MDVRGYLYWSLLDNYEWKVHTDRMQRQDYDMARYAWCGDYNEASTYLDLLTSYSGHNNGEFYNDAYDKLMKDSKTAEDPQPLYKDAERILAEEMPIIPIYHYANVDMIAEGIIDPAKVTRAALQNAASIAASWNCGPVASSSTAPRRFFTSHAMRLRAQVVT